jgi:cobalt-zinc-cadmium efflux system membrane fusion protein
MKNLIILSSIFIFISACNRNNPNQKTGDQEHAHVSDIAHQITLFSEESEFFVEYPGLIINTEAEFAVHLTRLDNYKPYTNGTVRVILEHTEGESAGGEISGGSQKQSGSVSETEVTGIFRVSLTPQIPGECNIILEFTRDGITEKKVSHHGWVARDSHDPVPEEAHEAIPDGIRFTKEQAWRSEFAVILLSPTPFTGIIKAGGEILAMPGEKQFIHARTTGIVQYSKNDLVAGGDIRAGEEMMTIQGQDLARENIAVDYAEAEIRFMQSSSEYQRRLKLFGENAISERQFIETRSSYITDSIKYYNLRQSYKSGGMKIISPIAGHIHELKVSQGEFVSTGQLIATVSSDRRLLLRADVPQQYFHRIHDIVTCNFRTSYHKDVWDVKDLDGKLLAIGSSVAENNQYLPVYFEAQNNGQLLEGAFAEFYLKTRPILDCIVIPVEAVLEEQGKYYVFVQTSGEMFRKQEIALGDLDGVKYLVDSGLSAGDRVVTQGNMLLKTASMSTALPGDSHQH